MTTGTEKPRKSLWKVIIPILGILAVVVLALQMIKSQIASKKSVTSGQPIEIAVGTVLPELTLKRYQGEASSLSSLGKKVVLINFWASWCEACIVEMPSIVKVRKDFAARGFEVLPINVDENPEVVLPKILGKLGIDFPVYLDEGGKLSELFDVHAIPFTVILDKNRKVLLMESGDRDWNSADLRAQLEQWLAAN